MCLTFIVKTFIQWTYLFAWKQMYILILDLKCIRLKYLKNKRCLFWSYIFKIIIYITNSRFFVFFTYMYHKQYYWQLYHVNIYLQYVPVISVYLVVSSASLLVISVILGNFGNSWQLIPPSTKRTIGPNLKMVIFSI